MPVSALASHWPRHRRSKDAPGGVAGADGADGADGAAMPLGADVMGAPFDAGVADPHESSADALVGAGLMPPETRSPWAPLSRTPGRNPLLLPAVLCGAGSLLWALAVWFSASGRGAFDAAGVGHAATSLTGRVLLLAGVLLGAWQALVLQRQWSAATTREQRLQHLLAQAADGHWELDAQLRLTAAQARQGPKPSAADRASLGQVPWDMPRLLWDEESLDQLRAHLELREPFRDLPVQVQGRQGRRTSPIHLLVSGSPRFTARGQFLGYRGVARDVSAAHETRSALQASESRYRELFALSPTALVLHRQGRIVGANPAALQLLGHASLQALQETHLIDYFEDALTPEQALAQLAPTPRSTGMVALPVQPTLRDLRLLVAGKRVWVRTAGVAVHSERGPAVMTLLIDDTERRAAEEAVRRSEALLSLVFATSPDLISLTELSSGRYAMVNRSFEQLLGWKAHEALGRTSLELGIWPTEQARRQFVRAVLDQGVVSEMALTFISQTGKPVPLRVSAARFTNERHDYIVINARDISASERDRLEREAILASASVGIVLVREGRFVLANRHFETLVDWPMGALLGEELQAVWPNEGMPATQATGQHEIELMRRDGSRFLARVRTHPIDPQQPHEGGRVCIVEDITEQRRFEQALQHARTEAEAASRAKSAFLANTSHELRTPLNAIAGLAALACEPQTSETARRTYLNQLTASVKALATTVTGILDLSQIMAGQVQIKPQVFDLLPLLRQLHESFAPAALAKTLRLHTDADPSAAVVLGDGLRLRQVLQLLLSNAIKFTTCGEVGLRVYRKGASALMRFEVRDSGPGIALALRESLFQPFFQADVSHTRQHGGSGLGLATCSELIKLMGGHMGMQDAVPGQPASGSLFWVELPLPAATRPAPPAPTSTPPPPPPLLAAVPLPAPESCAADARARLSSLNKLGTLQGLRVLMVDDNEVNRLVACATLEQWGVLVVQATDGAQAVEAVARAAQSQPPGAAFDAVLMDLQMPVMSGFDATRAIRARSDSQALPIIALTAAALESERAQALAAGMNDFITKPIDAERLRAAMLHWCGRESGPPTTWH